MLLHSPVKEELIMEELRRIENPIARMAVAAITTGSIATFAAATVIGVMNSESTDYKSALSAAAVAAGSGALVGGLSGRSRARSELTTTAAPSLWSDWRNFVVVRKVKESAEITSFYLKPEDNGEIPLFHPGQFLTIKLDIPGQSRPVIRTYSLSDYTNEYYRLSIKREPMPKGLDVPPGIASNFMHDFVQEGATIPAKPPNGKFFIDPYKSLPAVLVSNGVGITPMISMAKACSRLNPDRPIWFLHGARDGAYHAFREEVVAIAQQHPNLRVHFRYSRPRAEDADRYHSTGYVDTTMLQEYIVPELEQQYGSTAAEYFLCGSPPFLQAFRDGLQAWDVPDQRVFFESFGGGNAAVEPKAVTSATNGDAAEAEIVFAKSGQTLTWHPDDGTILEFAEANDLDPAYSCRQGICLTCMCQLQAGEIEYETPPIGTPDEGAVLICIAKPKTSRIVLDL
jgi:uncharacterized protein